MKVTLESQFEDGAFAAFTHSNQLPNSQLPSPSLSDIHIDTIFDPCDASTLATFLDFDLTTLDDSTLQFLQREFSTALCNCDGELPHRVDLSNSISPRIRGGDLQMDLGTSSLPTPSESEFSATPGEGNALPSQMHLQAQGSQQFPTGTVDSAINVDSTSPTQPALGTSQDAESSTRMSRHSNLLAAPTRKTAKSGSRRGRRAVTSSPSTGKANPTKFILQNPIDNHSGGSHTTSPCETSVSFPLDALTPPLEQSRTETVKYTMALQPIMVPIVTPPMLSAEVPAHSIDPIKSRKSFSSSKRRSSSTCTAFDIPISSSVSPVANYLPVTSESATSTKGVHPEPALGREQKRVRPDESNASLSEELTEEMDEIARRRMKNTLAARRSRQRKMTRLTELEAIVENLQRENDELRARIAEFSGDAAQCARPDKTSEERGSCSIKRHLMETNGSDDVLDRGDLVQAQVHVLRPAAPPVFHSVAIPSFRDPIVSVVKDFMNGPPVSGNFQSLADTVGATASNEPEEFNDMFAAPPPLKFQLRARTAASDEGYDRVVAETHLVAFQHGLWGVPDNLYYVANTLRKTYPGVCVVSLKANAATALKFVERDVPKKCDLLVVCMSTMPFYSVSLQVISVTASIEQLDVRVSKFSFVGYSLGGLIARCAAGVLWTRGYFSSRVMMSYSSFATPHLGAAPSTHSFFGVVQNVAAVNLLGPTGDDMAFIGAEKGIKTVLERMSEEESVEYKALAAFRKRTLYANVLAYIDEGDPFTNFDAVQLTYHPTHSQIVLTHHPIPPPPLPTTGISDIAVYAGVGVMLVAAIPLIIGGLTYSGWRAASARHRVASFETKWEKQGDSLEGQGQSKDTEWKQEEPLEESSSALSSELALEAAEDTIGRIVENPDGMDVYTGTPIPTKIPTNTDNSSTPTTGITNIQLGPRRPIFTSLNKLAWNKFLVCIPHRRSHAAIVVREKRWEEYNGAVTHWVEGFEV
ncbi:hypothetical protein HDU93_009280 [Gonapodya sp. JEL0774]|nr:hypothetical protein HDU93_009280 [Gonapodya sp. JEL0774]